MRSHANELLLEQFLYKFMRDMAKYNLPHRVRPIVDCRMSECFRKSSKFYPVKNIHVGIIPAQLYSDMLALPETLAKYFPMMVPLPRRIK